MKYLFYAFLLVGFYHIIYESIILPSLRLRMRFRLFEIRDHLRALKHNEHDCCSDQVFSILQDSINTGLSMLHRTDLIMLMKAERQIESSELLRNQIAQRNSVLANVIDPDVKDIMRSITHVGRTAVLLNSGGWFIYVVPAMMTLAALGRIKTLVREFMMFPEDRFAGDCTTN